MQIDDTDLKAFKAGLQSGLGLTQSAALILYSPKEMTEYLKKNQDFLKECEQAVKYAAKVLLVMSQEYLSNQKLDKWKKQNHYISQFISSLNYWEGICKKSDISDEKVSIAFAKTKNKTETATLLGLEPEELEAYLFQNPFLRMYIDKFS